MNVRISQRFTLRSPLSHIGETISTIAYLVQEPILQPDDTVEEVFAYSGNAWRGQLRDLMATYLLEHIGNPTIGLDAFHLLYSGGSIGGPQNTDIAQARAYRSLLPMIALLGGGVGNQVLPGKVRVSNAYPLCREALPVLPAGMATDVSYRSLTIEKSFSRKDDAKDDRINGSIINREPALAQGELISDAKPKTRPDAPPQQMRMTVELLIAGTTLVSHVDLLDVMEIELGCFVAALHAFSRSPHIGGQARMGHGLVTLVTEMLDLDTGEIVSPFVTVASMPVLSSRANDAKQAYDDHLRGMYDAMLAANGSDIRRMIGAAS